jgi:hypothetical protein
MCRKRQNMSSPAELHMQNVESPSRNRTAGGPNLDVKFGPALTLNNRAGLITKGSKERNLWTLLQISLR